LTLAQSLLAIQNDLDGQTSLIRARGFLESARNGMSEFNVMSYIN